MKKTNGAIGGKELLIINQKSKIISLLELNRKGGTNYCIISCWPFRITKTTLIGTLARSGQDQHLKLNPQSHILFYKACFDN